MGPKYIFITGGVVSGLGKGITAASLGRLLKNRGFKIEVQKLDPYLNVDPGTMSPYQHGEVFVTDDGAETDLDLGHYERFIDECFSQESNITSGQVYSTVIAQERRGDFQGGTVQVIPHITNEIKNKIKQGTQNSQIAIIEIGGTVGDIESLPFLEAIRQLSREKGRNNCLFIHTTLVPYLNSSRELKSKPTQHSVKELLSIGIQPDIIILRSENEISPEIREKISLFCNVSPECVIQNIDMPILYEIPIALEKEGLSDIVCKRLGLDCKTLDLKEWKDMVHTLKNPTKTVNIALVGKYIALRDAYLSVAEALRHGGIKNKAEVNIQWIESDTLTEETIDGILANADGIIVPGGFGVRGTEGKILACEYARKNNIPYFGICLGLQIAIIEFARNVLGYEDAHSAELEPKTKHPVIDLMPSQKDVKMLGGTMRLGLYPCRIDKKSGVSNLYETDLIHERHRHRYEVNNEYRKALTDNGMLLAGISPDGHIVEMVEIPSHPWFVACQFHPEFKSRPNRPHPLFASFIGAASERV